MCFLVFRDFSDQLSAISRQRSAISKSYFLTSICSQCTMRAGAAMCGFSSYSATARVPSCGLIINRKDILVQYF